MGTAKNEWEAVIGLELHAQLATKTKQFCRCPVRFTSTPKEANRYVCPICLGHPGVLPVLNARSVELALRLAIAAGARISRKNVFARKNYFYPDLPKGYQISQYDAPLAEGGSLPYYFTPPGKKISEVREARFIRMHLEEDTGKSFHLPDGSSSLDFNRAGVPLLEIVTEPDFRSAEEAVSYLEEVRLTMIYLGVSEANMELGQMRCEPNVSVRPAGTDELRPKVEIKNLNSFAVLKKAVNYEIERQVAVWESGGEVKPQTMRWDEDAEGFDGQAGSTVVMRTKETADDYRYFDEPDLPPLVVTDEMIERARAAGGETAFTIQSRLKADDGLSDYDARNIAQSRENYEWYRALAVGIGDKKLACNWVLGEISRWRGELGEQFKADAEMTLTLLSALEKKEITNPQAKEIFEGTARTGKDPLPRIEKLKKAPKLSDSELDAILDEAINANPKPVSDYKAGKKNAVMALVGQVMKMTRGAANPQTVRELLEKKLDG